MHKSLIPASDVILEAIPWAPHKYQKKSLKFLLEHAAAALFLDPGLGKTSIALAAIKFLKQRKLLSKVLLIAPLRVCYSVWPAEIKKWEDFTGLKFSLLHGPKKNEALKADADIYIINPEGLSWLLQAEKSTSQFGRTKVNFDMQRWKKLDFDTLVVDELSKFKHTNTIRFKALKLTLGTFSRRWGLTGSPAPNGLLDLFGQCFVLDQGRSLGPYITHFRMKYFTESYDGYNWVLREGADQEIYERIKPLSLRMAAEDYLEMPELIEQNIHVTLEPGLMETYNQVHHELFAQIAKGHVIAKNAAAASMKCRQIANGGVYLDQEMCELLRMHNPQREWVNLHNEKIDALEDLIDELQGAPLLVAYDFEHDLDRLRKRFGRDIPYIGGGVSAKRSNELVNLWNRGKLPVLFGHPQAVAHGLNLQEVGCHVCWHSLTWNYELYDQLIRRVHRQGNKAKRVFVYHLIAEDTIDEAILEALKSKRRGQNALFDALKKMKK
jgi:SNF2 family DNA or RNA helicase